MVAQGWLVAELAERQGGLDNTSLYLGMIGALGSLPMLVFTLFAGVVADRHDRRRIIIATQTAAMLLAFALAVLTGSGTVRIWMVAVIAMLLGVVNAFDMPTRQAFVKDMVGPEDLLNAIALNSSLFNGARMIGPAVAGVLIAAFAANATGSNSLHGIASVFYVNAISYIAVIAGLLAIRIPRPTVITGFANVWGHLREGFHYVAGQPMIRMLLLVMSVYSVFGFSYIVLMPVIARQILHIEAARYGLLVSIGGIGAFIGALLLASNTGQVRKGLVLLLGGLISALALFGLAWSRLFWLSGVSLALVGAGLVVISASINSLIQEATPDALRGRVISMWTFIFAGFTPIGALYAGTMAHYTSPSASIALAACGCLAILGYITLRARWLWRID